MATGAPINLINSCTQLSGLLSSALNRNGELNPVFQIIDYLVENVPRISLDLATYILRNIFYPFGTRCLSHGSQVLALKMVKFMNWWLMAKPLEKAPSKPLLELVRERRIMLIIRNQQGKSMLRQVYKYLTSSKPQTFIQIDFENKSVTYCMRFADRQENLSYQSQKISSYEEICVPCSGYLRIDNHFM